MSFQLDKMRRESMKKVEAAKAALRQQREDLDKALAELEEAEKQHNATIKPTAQTKPNTTRRQRQDDADQQFTAGYEEAFDRFFGYTIHQADQPAEVEATARPVKDEHHTKKVAAQAAFTSKVDGAVYGMKDTFRKLFF